MTDERIPLKPIESINHGGTQTATHPSHFNGIFMEALWKQEGEKWREVLKIKSTPIAKSSPTTL